MAIKDWPYDERPREKLLTLGAQSLSSAELFAIFIQSGTKGKTAVDVARDALQYFGGLRSLLNANFEQFCQYPGFGISRFALLQAALEIGRRYMHETLMRMDVLRNSFETRCYISSRLRDRKSEVFACLFLDNGNRIISFDELFCGTINTTNVYARELVKYALMRNAAGVIFAHNHPSGEPEPSEADIFLTQQLKQTLEAVDVRVLDHIVVGDGQTVSFAERGWL